MCDEEEPVSFEEAQSSENWVATMQTEYDAIVKNDTWYLTNLHVGKRLLVPSGYTSLSISMMVALNAIKQGSLQKGMLKKRA